MMLVTRDSNNYEDESDSDYGDNDDVNDNDDE